MNELISRFTIVYFVISMTRKEQTKVRNYFFFFVLYDKKSLKG